MTKQVAVPTRDSSDQDLIEFAHTYNGYELHGGMEGLTMLFDVVRDQWMQTRRLPANIDVLRACLFYAVRGHRHSGGYEPFGQDPFVAALIESIRGRAGDLLPAKGTVV